MNDVQAYLEAQEKDLLVRIVMEQAMEDEELRERLLLRASRMGGLDLAAFHRAIDDAVDFDDDYYGPPWKYARGIQNVVGTIEELLEEGFAQEVIELSEYALASVERAMNYDVDGTIGEVLEALEGLHHKACKQAKPDQEALAKRLFEWELGGDHDTFFDAVNTYADVLGEKGLAEYRRLAEKEWADVPALGPDREDRPRYYGKREILADIMQTLAYRSGDVEAVVAIKSKDLSSPFTYLEIARLYKEAGDEEKALEWAEEGAWVFPGGGHQELRRFLADEYHDRGRHEEAMGLIWKGFAEVPRLHDYQELEGPRRPGRIVGAAGARRRWASCARTSPDRRRSQTVPTCCLRWITRNWSRYCCGKGTSRKPGDEAKEGGCSDGLWLDLAARREEDHPEDSLAIYQERIEPLVNQTNNRAYKEAYDLLLRVREILDRLGRDAEFEEYVNLLRLEYKRKRNFMKLLDEME